MAEQDESKQNEPQTAVPGADQAASIEDERFQINTQYLKDYSFENPNAPVIYLQMTNQPAISVNVDVRAQKLQSRVFEVVLNTDIKARVEDKTAFIIEVSYAGLISISKNVPDEEIQEILLVEVPRFLFPFSRDIITTATRDGGFPPLLINPVDFRKLYKNQQARAQQGENAEGAGGNGTASNGGEGQGDDGSGKA